MDYEKEIPFGAFDSELMHQEISIPEGFTATIEGNKIILTRTESEDERIRKSLIEYFGEQCDMSDWNGVYGYQVLAWLKKQGNPTGINPSEFDLRLNKLLKQFETLPKEELASSLSFYLNVIQNDGTYKPNEKQGEQNNSDVKDYNSIDPHFGKSIDKVESKFKVGDWIAHNKANFVFRVTSVGSNAYGVVNPDGYTKSISFKHEGDYHTWTAYDAKEGDVLTNGDFPCIFKHCDGSGSLYVYCGINGNNVFSILSEDPNNTWSDYSEQYFPATKEQRDTLFAKMKEAGYKWDAEKKELKKIEDEEYNGDDYGIDGLWHAINILEETLGKVSGYQSDDGFLSHQCAITAVKKLYGQKSTEWSEEDRTMAFTLMRDVDQMSYISKEGKNERIGWLNSLDEKFTSTEPAWSEEDEKMIQDIINDIAIVQEQVYCKSRCEDEINWLKSLRPQNRWKPSEEQIGVIEAIINNRSFQRRHLDSLYEQLKKLKRIDLCK